MDLTAIQSPTLILDEKQCRENIRQMADKARQHRVEFIPHFKTHQSHKIGRWFREEGIDRITVSSVQMAAYFAEDGWSDITIAFPVNTRLTSKINDLHKKVELTLFVNSIRTARLLDQNLEREITVQTEIDTGFNRSGIPHDNLDEIEQLLDEFRHSEKLNFKGFYTHNGQTYEASSRNEIAEHHGIALYRLNQLRKQLSSKYPDIALSIGDTPSCSAVDNFAGINSIHPGNFVFYDINQCRIGSCSMDQIATILAVPVVGRREERNELIVHGGAIHLSKDYELLEDGSPYYGVACQMNENGWHVFEKRNHVRTLSQEHGILACSDDVVSKYREGDLLGILPIHSCLTANLMAGYHTLEGNSIDHMEGSG